MEGVGVSGFRLTETRRAFSGNQVGKGDHLCNGTVECLRYLLPERNLREYGRQLGITLQGNIVLFSKLKDLSFFAVPMPLKYGIGFSWSVA